MRGCRPSSLAFRLPTLVAQLCDGHQRQLRGEQLSVERSACSGGGGGGGVAGREHRTGTSVRVSEWSTSPPVAHSPRIIHPSYAFVQAAFAAPSAHQQLPQGDRLPLLRSQREVPLLRAPLHRPYLRSDLNDTAAPADQPLPLLGAVAIQEMAITGVARGRCEVPPEQMSRLRTEPLTSSHESVNSCNAD